MIRGIVFSAIALSLVAATPALHIELVKSTPSADAVLDAAPAELVLTFSAELDYARSAVTLRGPNGSVKLSDRVTTEDPKALKVAVEGAMPAGRYTVSWTAAPLDDHGGRGRFAFQVGR